MTKIQKFDKLIEALAWAGAEDGSYNLLEKRTKGVTYLLVHSSDRGTDEAFHVYAVNDREQFIDDVLDELDALGVTDVEFEVGAEGELIEAAWDVLSARHTVVLFDELF